MIELVWLGGLITIGPGVRVADTPFGTLPRVMWSHVADAVWARVGATIRATSRNAPSVLAISLRIVDPQSHAAVHASSEGTSGYGVERTDRTRVDYRKYCLNVARDRLSVRWCRLGVRPRWCHLAGAASARC